jgi:DNA-binding NarL/FixJ family response regulator
MYHLDVNTFTSNTTAEPNNEAMTGPDMKRVLIAERDQGTASRLAKVLTSHAYSVVASVCSGEEAVTGTQWLRPDLVFMGKDLEGDVDGVLAAEEIGLTTQSRILFIEDDEQPLPIKATSDTSFIRRSADDQTVLMAADSLTERDRFADLDASEWGAELMMV